MLFMLDRFTYFVSLINLTALEFEFVSGRNLITATVPLYPSMVLVPRTPVQRPKDRSNVPESLWSSVVPSQNELLREAHRKACAC